MTILLVGEALGWLLLFDLLATSGFAAVHEITRRRPVAARTPAPEVTARVCRAVEEACIWYFKRAYCLQRSTVATWMLRRRGVAAELVIGFRPAPVDSHAWVEVGGQVVNDRPQYQKFFRVLDRL
jgi:Transglutaminase-like superfamily